MYIYGASGHAKVVLESIESSNELIEGVFDDNPLITSLFKYQVVSPFQMNLISENSQLIIAIGNNTIRRKIATSLQVNFGNAIHASSIISTSVKLGKGVAIMANTTINAEAIIGDHVIINTSASIDHDCRIEDFAHIAPNATLCGGVTVGEGTLIGAGVTILPNISIGKWAVIGAGSVVTKDVPDYVTVKGNPSR